MKKILLITLIILSSLAARAQRISHRFDNVAMPVALRQLNSMTRRYTINFIYNDLEDFRVTTDIKDKPLPDAIRQIIGFYPIDMTWVDDSIISVECSQKEGQRYKGRIIDEAGRAAEYANIALLSPADSTLLAGGVSNADGYFVIPCQAAKVIVRVSYVGYKTVCHAATSSDLGTISLTPDRYVLKGITVKRQRPPYKMTSGGMTIDVENSVLSQLGTAIDVLGQLPRVAVNGSDVKVFAKGTPLIYINNKKVTSNQELTELKSEDIKNVEVITTPGARYDASVKSVIRIRTRKPTGEGLSISNYATGSYDTMWAGREFARIKYRSKGLEVESATGLYSESSKEDNQVQTTLRPSGTTLDVDQHMWDHERDNIISQSVKASYDFDANNAIGATYWYYKTLSDHIDLNGLQQIARDGNAIGLIRQDQRMSRLVGPRHELDLYYVGNWGKWSVDVNGTYVHMKYREDLSASELSDDLSDRDVLNNGGQRSDMWATNVIVSRPLWKGNLTFGTEYTHTKSQGFYINEQQYVPSSQTLLYESNIAGFADYTLPLGHYALQAGLRYEHVKTDYYSYGQWEAEPSRRYGNLFPSVSLSWNKNLWSWQAAYTMKTSRPSYRNLRNFMQYDNRYLYEGGNPYLRPEYDHNIELSAVYKWLSLSAGYNYMHKVMLTSIGLYNQQEIAFMTTRNMGHEQSVYASVTAAPTLGCYHPSWQMGYTQMFYQEPTQLRSNHPAFSWTLRNNFVFPHSWLLGLTLTACTDSYHPMRYSKGFFTLSAQLRKAFLKNRLIFNLQAEDLTKGGRERWTMYGIGVTEHKDAYNFSRRIRLTVTYNFNVSRSRYKGTGAGNAEKSRL